MVQGGENTAQRIPGILLGVGALVFVLVLRASGAIEGLELAVYDRLVRQNVGSAEGRSPVLAVSIGEAEFERYGYPIPDAVLARALERLGDRGAAAIGVDLYRDRPGGYDEADLAGWADLERVVEANPRIVMSELLSPVGESGTPAPAFAAPDQVGFNNFAIDRGRAARRGYLIDWDASGQARLALGLRLALLYLAREGLGMGPDPVEPDWVRLGATTMAPLLEDFGAYDDLDAGGYQFMIDYARPADAFDTVSLGELLEGGIGRERVAGRIAILGTDSPSVKDDFNAPIAPGRSVKGYRLHAHLVDQLTRVALEGDVPTGAWQEPLETLWILAWGLCGIGLSLGLASLGWAVPVLMVGLALLYAVTSGLFAAGVWAPTVAPALAWVGAGGLALGDRARREVRAQRQLMGMFRRFASSEVADALWRQRDEFMEGGRPKPQRVTLTALLSDLKGYTEAAEKLEPDALMTWIDSYMDAMTRVIEESYDGHVDDYVGDGIKANFGVPIPSETPDRIAADARRAVRCAIAMGATLERLNAEWAEQGWPTGRQRIGLSTGAAVVGAIGSGGRTKYTSVGDTINTAARLESLGGELDFDRESELQRILIGDSTRRALGDAFDVEPLGRHAVKGKAEPIEVYRVWGERVPESTEEER